MKKRISLIKFIIASTLILITFIRYAYSQPPPILFARVEGVKGEVMFKKPDEIWQQAKIGTILNEGDLIKTGAKSKATIQIRNMEEVISVVVDEKTEASIESLLINKLTGKQDSKMLLDVGHLGVITKKFDRGTNFNVKTPNAIVELTKYGFIVKYKEKKAHDNEE